MSVIPLVIWRRIGNATANGKCVEWGHFLGSCRPPFCVQSFGLFFGDELVSIAMTASTVNKTCGGYPRQSCCELVRLCSHPEHRDFTRVALRLWRMTAAEEWERSCWPVQTLVSYANNRHSGDVYRFDGWKKVAKCRAGKAGGGWNRGKEYEAKTVWAFELKATGREEHSQNTKEANTAG